MKRVYQVVSQSGSAEVREYLAGMATRCCR